MADYVEITPDSVSFVRLAAALSDEADGREWRREFDSAMREALEPGVSAVRSQILARGGSGQPHGGQSLRQAIAAGVQVERLRGGTPGAKIRARKTGMPRGFFNAPKRFNQTSFRHPVFGRDAWSEQRGAPGWFDDTLQRLQPMLLERALAVLEARADRVSRNGPR